MKFYIQQEGLAAKPIETILLKKGNMYLLKLIAINIVWTGTTYAVVPVYRSLFAVDRRAGYSYIDIAVGDRNLVVTISRRWPFVRAYWVIPEGREMEA